jgi:hypothetical protein
MPLLRRTLVIAGLAALVVIAIRSKSLLRQRSEPPPRTPG